MLRDVCHWCLLFCLSLSELQVEPIFWPFQQAETLKNGFRLEAAVATKNYSFERVNRIRHITKPGISLDMLNVE